MKFPRAIQCRGNRPPAVSAFTMVEIAISIAIVAFALVAIIGVMPTGLNVQSENRHDTIINQDATVLLEAIRGGTNSYGLTALTNNLEWIDGVAGTLGFAYGQPLAAPNNTPAAIVSLLSMPRQQGTNFCRARFRSFTGALRDRDTNSASVAFGYIVTSEINPVEDYAPGATNYTRYLTNNLYDVRLTFRWPVYGISNTGPGKLTVRTLVSGQLRQDTNGFPGFWFFYPSSYFGP